MTKLAIVGLAFAACASSPEVRDTRIDLQKQANITLGAMRARDPGIDPVLRDAYAYAVFPDASGAGVLYEYGRPVGYVRLQGEVQPTAELILLTPNLQAEHVFLMPSGKPTVEVAGRDQRIEYLGT
jgi:hypothetical protein